MKHSPDILDTMAASDEANKFATALNNPRQFKILGYVLNRNQNRNKIITVFGVTVKESSNNVKGGEIDKHLPDGIDKLLIENKCDRTSQEELSTDEADAQRRIRYE